MAKNASSERLITPEFRGSFVFLHENDRNGKRSAAMLFPKRSDNWAQDLPWAAKAMGEVLKAQYPGGAGMPPVFAQAKPGCGKPWPVGDGDAASAMGVVTEEHKGHWVIRASSTNFDPARNLLNGTNGELGLMTAQQCFSGSYFEAQIHAYFYVNEGLGISFGLDNVKFIREGEAFSSGGGSNAADAFGVQPAATGATAAFDGSGQGQQPPAEGVPEWLK